MELSGVIRHFRAREVFARGAEIPVHTFVCRVEPEQRASILC